MRPVIYPLIILASLITLSACGFRPMASVETRQADNAVLAHELASIDIQTSTAGNQRLLKQRFQAALEDLINPGELTRNDHRYVLQVNLVHAIAPGFINPDGTAQRFLIELRSNFVLTRLADNKIIERGILRRSSSYSNLPNSFFSTYVAEQDTLKRLAEQLAEEYRLKLASLLARPPEEPSPEPSDINNNPLTEGFQLKGSRPDSNVTLPGF